MGDKFDPDELFREGYGYGVRPENNEESTDKEVSNDVPPMQLLEGDQEEVKEGKGLTVLTPNKLLT